MNMSITHACARLECLYLICEYHDTEESAMETCRIFSEKFVSRSSRMDSLFEMMESSEVYMDILYDSRVFCSQIFPYHFSTQDMIEAPCLCERDSIIVYRVLFRILLEYCFMSKALKVILYFLAADSYIFLFEPSTESRRCSSVFWSEKFSQRDLFFMRF